jgi:hypothetical protein
MSTVKRSVQRVLRWVAIAVLADIVVIVVLAITATVAGAPPEHDVIPVNTTPLAVQVVLPPLGSPASRLSAAIAPTTSLGAARCAAWQESNAGACPDTSALAQMYWPELTEQPQTIYVGLLWPDCIASAPHFNVEFSGNVESANVILHCHSTQAWFGGPSYLGRNSVGAPVLQLVMVPTAPIEGRQLWVYREDRVERWLEDDVRTTLLGVVAIR